MNNSVVSNAGTRRQCGGVYDPLRQIPTVDLRLFEV